MQQPQLHSAQDHVLNDDEREEMCYATLNKREGLEEGIEHSVCSFDL